MMTARLPIEPLVKRCPRSGTLVDKAANLSYNGLEVDKSIPLTLMPRRHSPGDELGQTACLYPFPVGSIFTIWWSGDTSPPAAPYQPHRIAVAQGGPDEEGETRHAGFDGHAGDDGLVYTFTLRTDIPWVRHDPERGETEQVLDEGGILAP